MQEKVSSLLCSVAEIDPKSITMKSDLVNDLGLSSLDVVNLVVMFEQEFGVDIPDRQIMKFGTVGDVVEYLTTHSI